ncbi:MAG: hypothetical protein CMA72_05815, partial [Euryarchaeota archaeon]|nr:hypothetical protein [Euryarchaeota archaeon]
ELKEELDELRGRVMPGNKDTENQLKKTGIRRRTSALVESFTKKEPVKKDETDVESATQEDEEEG